VDGPDWRLHGQERYLAGARLRHAQYRAPSESWTHDHCAFCFRKLMEQPGNDIAAAGWQTEDAYHWICDTCFDDFREHLGFVVMDEGAPRRGVELHDAAVLEVTARSGVVVVRLEAFVHDDWASTSCKGCWQRIDLGFNEATCERRGLGEARILDGSLQVNDRVRDNILAIPFHETGAVSATMTGVDFELTVRAHHVWLRVAGAPGKREG
jgi:hypothetical protein